MLESRGVRVHLGVFQDLPDHPHELWHPAGLQGGQVPLKSQLEPVHSLLALGESRRRFDNEVDPVSPTGLILLVGVQE